MIANKRVCILEEFTRFGGGQIVFESVYNGLKGVSFDVHVVTDRNHRFLPSYIPDDGVIETGLKDPNWDRPALLFPKIIGLKRELKQIVPHGLTFNNHPNVFVFNATINFWHEVFGFMVQRPGRTDKIALSFVRKTGLFREYNGAYFLTNGKFTGRQIRETFSYLGVSKLTIEQVDLPVMIPDKVCLDRKERVVLTFGRISPDKSLESALEIALRVKDVRFVIAGRVLERDRRYLEMLDKEKGENVSIIPNPSAEVKDSLYRKAKVYLHTKRNENYGISVAEAVSYGCCPVVPKEGGAYEDVLMAGALGYGYSNTEEAVQFVRQAIEASTSELENIFVTRERFLPEKFAVRLSESFNKFI